MESLSLLCDAIAIVLVVYMGWRDDARPGQPQTSLFRTLDEDAIRLRDKAKPTNWKPEAAWKNRTAWKSGTAGKRGAGNASR